jgi:hypothetical protein
MVSRRLRSSGVIRDVASRTHIASISAIVSNISDTRPAIIGVTMTPRRAVTRPCRSWRASHVSGHRHAGLIASNAGQTRYQSFGFAHAEPRPDLPGVDQGAITAISNAIQTASASSAPGDAELEGDTPVARCRALTAAFRSCA